MARGSNDEKVSACVNPKLTVRTRPTVRVMEVINPSKKNARAGGPGVSTRILFADEEWRRNSNPSKRGSVDVVLLPVQGGVGLDDDVFVRSLLEFVNEHGLAGLQSFGDFRIHPDRKVWALMVGGGHLARFGLDFVAQRGDGLDHAGAGAIRARLAEHALEYLLGALAGDADEAELIEGQRL